MIRDPPQPTAVSTTPRDDQGSHRIRRSFALAHASAPSSCGAGGGTRYPRRPLARARSGRRRRPPPCIRAPRLAPPAWTPSRPAVGARTAHYTPGLCRQNEKENSTSQPRPPEWRRRSTERPPLAPAGARPASGRRCGATNGAGAAARRRPESTRSFDAPPPPPSEGAASAARAVQAGRGAPCAGAPRACPSSNPCLALDRSARSPLFQTRLARWRGRAVASSPTRTALRTRAPLANACTHAGGPAGRTPRSPPSPAHRRPRRLAGSAAAGARHTQSRLESDLETGPPAGCWLCQPRPACRLDIVWVHTLEHPACVLRSWPTLAQAMTSAHACSARWALRLERLLVSVFQAARCNHIACRVGYWHRITTIL